MSDSYDRSGFRMIAVDLLDEVTAGLTATLEQAPVSFHPPFRSQFRQRYRQQTVR
jgi:hypothetical protein